MICPMPWRTDLGGPRVQLELADELRAIGHHVDKFSWEDARSDRRLPRPSSGPLGWFSAKAQRRIRESAGEYDVIDAHQGTVTTSKASLGFGGSMVIRSVGLHHRYAHFLRRADPHRAPGPRHWLGRRREAMMLFAERRAVERSFDAADRIIVPNRAEFDFLQLDPRWGSKARIVPLPISSAEFSALSDVWRSVNGQPRLPVVSFVGSWHARKGSGDWPRLAKLISEGLPGTHLRFLGTGITADDVRASLGAFASGSECVPHFHPTELPGLLRGVRVGACPSYIEGYGIAVVEQLAAGIPVVAYDVPGPRDILGPMDPSLLVRPGDVEAMARRIITLLAADPAGLAALRDRCVARAAQLTWRHWVDTALSYYRERDERVG